MQHGIPETIFYIQVGFCLSPDARERHQMSTAQRENAKTNGCQIGQISGSGGSLPDGLGSSYCRHELSLLDFYCWMQTGH